jgi:hypothetical protein
MKASIGATPAPGPTRITGTVGSAGRVNVDYVMRTRMWVCAAFRAFWMYWEHRPSFLPPGDAIIRELNTIRIILGSLLELDAIVYDLARIGRVIIIHTSSEIPLMLYFYISVSKLCPCVMMLSSNCVRPSYDDLPINEIIKQIFQFVARSLITHEFRELVQL